MWCNRAVGIRELRVTGPIPPPVSANHAGSVDRTVWHMIFLRGETLNSALPIDSQYAFVRRRPFETLLFTLLCP
jgi:hypothetical protein